MNKKVLKLENNREYFVMNELYEGDINYLLLMNVDDESDIRIVKKISLNDEDFIEDIQGDILQNLKQKFKSLIDEDKKIYV